MILPTCFVACLRLCLGLLAFVVIFFICCTIVPVVVPFLLLLVAAAAAAAAVVVVDVALVGFLVVENTIYRKIRRRGILRLSRTFFTLLYFLKNITTLSPLFSLHSFFPRAFIL